jgi:7,8-dihydropterin-6-yl-methyl-4-(beta-D-ribofuranosyl)aminobenzene 5'-phosphate synthase
MRNSISIGSVDHASLTVLVDNKADLIVESSEQVKYFTDEPLLAEHGFSVLIQPEDSDRKILWDAGGSKVALKENMSRMKLDSATIAKIALSHGHSDHYAALTGLIIDMELLPEDKEWDAPVNTNEIEKWLEISRVPIVAHPAAFRERWWEKDDGTMVGPFLPPSAQELEAAGAKLVLSEDPYKLGPGCWTTGFIPRNSFENSGRSKQARYRVGADLIPDDIEDDQAIVINVEGKGLIVLAGCAHSGIINTINHAKNFFEIDSIYAVMGGFHLARANDDEIEQTIGFMRDIDPTFIIPSHCTGFNAISRFAQEFPDQFIEGIVGTTYFF